MATTVLIFVFRNCTLCRYPLLHGSSSPIPCLKTVQSTPRPASSPLPTSLLAPSDPPNFFYPVLFDQNIRSCSSREPLQFLPTLNAMAPFLDDDFVFTISDNDDILDRDDDADDAASPPPAVLAGKGKKRKRDEDVADAKAEKKKSKKAKREQKNGKRAKEPLKDEESAEEAGEDDGAIASDFEFQVGDVDTGVLEDFDGWGLEQ